jgi:hypothetical protein
MDCLKDYAHPRDKVSDLLRKGHITRIKKGLYVLGEEYRQGAISREVLANLMYGPSYISLDYALHYHGLIPERVEAIASVTLGRSRRFLTPVGLFIYRMIPLESFRIGMDSVELGDGRSFLIATPEKALADKIRDSRGASISTQRDMKIHLFDNLRIDKDALIELSSERIEQIAERYRSQRIRMLARLIKRLKAK